ncbi:MAG: hypothetical protein J6T10_32325 [Methanobrevibacter sp.]|nr:hypothetical protein [Methanobrevibacter sp.]
MKKIIIRNVDLISSWETDFGDYQARVKIGENNENIGEVVVSYDRYKVLDVIGKKEESKVNNNEIEMAISVIVANEDFENIKRLPKISKCSILMERVYDNVCESESSMCFIENDDEFCNTENIKKLKEEVKELGLSDCIRFDEDGYLVVGYGDVELSFIDDRGLQNETIKN